ncbi:MAG: HAMP domain-containing histidine kinase [Oscillospiraceae bacterium]|nr:HAMP domain-containing histidine kinase [Oscillospiraceae bacterium]
MKRYSRMLACIAAVLTAGIVLLLCISFSYQPKSADPLLINDLVQTVREHWDAPEEIDRSRFSMEVRIFDQNGFLCYDAGGERLSGIGSAQQALREGCLCLPVTEGSRFLGTVVIPDPDRVQYETTVGRLRLAAILTGLLFLLCCGLYGLYVYRTILLPFRKMERFAVQVAAGNLDEPLMLEQDNLFGSFTHSFDIMRIELKEARQRENALKLKEKELVASLSHDLKTPITGIKLICELLSVKVQDAYVSGKVESIHQKAEQINVLVSDLLASTLDDLGELTVNCRDESAAILHELLQEHDSRGLVEEQGGIPDCLLLTDRQRLSQIIGNLISNSYKYAGTKIEVSYRIRDSFLEMAVQDYGEGVPADELDLLTNKFYRGKLNSEGKEGSGLGLYIASELMAKMGGELICSNRNGGFCVTLLLPLS